MRGSPRVQYKRRYILLSDKMSPGDTAAYTLIGIGKYRNTVGFSADDAGIGDLDYRDVVVVKPDLWGGDAVMRSWYATIYPGANYYSINGTPEELDAWLFSHPMSEKSSPPPEPPTPAMGLCLFSGADTDAGFSRDLEIIRVAKISHVKITTNATPTSFDRLVSAGVKPENIMLRLLVNFPRDRRVFPDEVFTWFGEPTSNNSNYPLSWFKNKGGLLVEVLNEPNLYSAPQDGMGTQWNSAAEFSRWMSSFVNMCRRFYPTLRFGLPGLAPSPNVSEWISVYHNIKPLFDWSGAHCYWTNYDKMTLSEHGAYWRRYESLGLPVYITEASNPSQSESFAEKARQYVEYPKTIGASWVKGVYYYVSRTQIEDEIRSRQHWDGTGIPTIVGSR